MFNFTLNYYFIKSIVKIQVEYFIHYLYISIFSISLQREQRIRTSQYDLFCHESPIMVSDVNNSQDNTEDTDITVSLTTVLHVVFRNTVTFVLTFVLAEHIG